MPEHTEWVVSSSVIVCEKETGRMVANCLPAGGIEGLSFGILEASAHATLIAAAPTMEAVLQDVKMELEAFAEGHCPQAVDAWHPLYERVASVLQQAKGEKDA